MDSFDRQWQRWFPEDRGRRPVPPAKRGWMTTRVILIVAAVIALLIFLNIFKGFYTEWLWFNSLGYGSVYATILKTKVLVFFSAAIIFCILFLGNLVLATRLAPRTEAGFWPWSIVRQIQPVLKWSTILGTILLSVIVGLAAQANWEVILRFFNEQPFGITDPVFHREIGFYVFSLPFLQLLRGWFLGALIVTLLGSTGVYALSYTVQRLRFDLQGKVKKSKRLLSGLAVTLFIPLVALSGCMPAAGGEGGEASTWPMLIFLVLIFVMFYFLMIRPQRKKQKEHEELVQELKRGDRVTTAGGIYGVIESTSEESIVIKVESGTTIRVARGSVAIKREK